MSVKIQSVDPRSPAAKAGIRAGETLVSINGNTINDTLDYGFYTFDRVLDFELDTRSVTVKKKDDYDEIGLNFETYLMDKKQTCRNKCIFCFIDQLPRVCVKLSISRMMTVVSAFYREITLLLRI